MASDRGLDARGTLAAYGYSTVALFTGGDLYFETAALLIAFLSLGRYLDAGVRRRASSSTTGNASSR